MAMPCNMCIYNSRNFVGALDIMEVEIKIDEIYNSRNFVGALDIRLQQNAQDIYNSRNFVGALDTNKVLQSL